MRSGGGSGGSVQCNYNIIYFLDFSTDSTLKKYFNQHYDLNTEIKSKIKNKLSCQGVIIAMQLEEKQER